MQGSRVEIFQVITVAGQPGEWTKRETGQRVTHCSWALIAGSCDQSLTVSCIVTQFARESFGICRFRGLCIQLYLIDLRVLKIKRSLHVKMLDRERKQLVYEVILLNKIWKNHLHSENMQWNYASFNVTLDHLMQEIMEFCMTFF